MAGRRIARYATGVDLDQFVWYTGASDVAARAGTWTFYDPLDLDETDETLFSTYLVQSEDTATLTFENRNDDSAGVGDELVYDAAGDDLSVRFTRATDGAVLSVEWNRTTGAGTQTNFEDETCCWSARPDFDDTLCP